MNTDEANALGAAKRAELAREETAFPQNPHGYAATTHVTVPLAVLAACYHALRSYEHGNGAPALAAACANELAQILGEDVIRNGVTK